jgi:hypothetical protein
MARSENAVKRPAKGPNPAARQKGRTTSLANKAQRDRMALPILKELWVSGIRSPASLAEALNRGGRGRRRGPSQKWTIVQVARLITEFRLDRFGEEHATLPKRVFAGEDKMDVGHSGMTRAARTTPG